MANRKVGLILNCKTPDGWRRLAVVYGKNGRLRPLTGLYKGSETPFTEEHYEPDADNNERPR